MGTRRRQHGIWPYQSRGGESRRGRVIPGTAYSSGIEPLWAVLKRCYRSTNHKMTAMHLARYINEYSRYRNIRKLAFGHPLANFSAVLRFRETLQH